MFDFFLSLIITACVLFHITTRYSRRGRLFSKIPGPTAYPIIGNLLRFNTTCLHEIWDAGRKISREYYPITRIWSVNNAMVSIRHPDDLEILLTNPRILRKGYVYRYIRPWLGQGLITSTGAKWRHRRKILTPAFHFSILKKYLEIANEEGQKCVASLKDQGTESVQDLMELWSHHTLKIICESAMGVNFDTINTEEVEKYKQAVRDFGTVVMYRTPRPYLSSKMIHNFCKIGIVQESALKVLHGFSRKVIRDRKEYHARTNNKYISDVGNDDESNQSIYDADMGQRKRLAMLDHLLSAQQKGLIEDEGIREEVDTFTFAGHDTTSVGMTYLLLLLAENKPQQERARAEATELLDRTGGKLTMTDLQELNYLERCIKESLRLYPPAATLIRYAEEELQLKHALVPAKTDIIIHIYDTHRDPNFWTEPDKFDPDRFLPENSKNRHPFAYIPFSAGPRNCIGQKYAMMELKSLASRILYDFYVEPVDRTADMKLMADIVIHPLEPMHVKFVKIHK